MQKSSSKGAQSGAADSGKHICTEPGYFSLYAMCTKYHKSLSKIIGTSTAGLELQLCSGVHRPHRKRKHTDIGMLH